MSRPSPMSRFYRTSRLVTAACLLAAGGAMQVQAEPVNYLILGDSISNGNGITNPYSYYLQDLFNEAGMQYGVDYDFLGGQATPGTTGTFLSDGVTPFDADHWGRNGYTAAYQPSSFRPATRSLQYDFENNLIDFTRDSDGNVVPTITNGGIFTTDVGGSREQRSADVVLVHIGTNQLRGDGPNNNLNTPSPETQVALDQLDVLFGDLRSAWDAGLISSDATILIAEIIPKGSLGSANKGTDDDAVRNSAIYNANIQSVIDALPEGDANDIAFKALFGDLVDMFQIDATQELADSLGVALGDIDIDGDQWVDWLEIYDGATNLNFDESSPIFGNLSGAGIDPVSSNPALLSSDQVHPTAVGYDLIAHQWFSALETQGIIPEPSSMALLGLGGLALLRRRRRA